MTKLMKIITEDSNLITYRPSLNKITGSVCSTILLQQVMFYGKNGKKFYKFRKPCTHKAYTEGDSWCEKLGFTPCEFDSAIQRIGYKYGKKDNIIKEEEALILYYTDNNRITWYKLNTKVLERKLEELYTEENEDKEAEQFRNHELHSNSGIPNYLVVKESRITNNTENYNREVNKDIIINNNKGSFSKNHTTSLIKKESLLLLEEWLLRDYCTKHKKGTKVYLKALKDLRRLCKGTFYEDIESLDIYEKYKNKPFTLNDWIKALDNYKLSFYKDYKGGKKIGVSYFLYNPYGFGAMKFPFLYYLENKPAKITSVLNLKDDNPEVTEILSKHFDISNINKSVIDASSLLKTFFIERKNTIPDKYLISVYEQLKLCEKACLAKNKVWGFALLTQEWFYSGILLPYLKENSIFVNKNADSQRKRLRRMNEERMERQALLDAQ